MTFLSWRRFHFFSLDNSADAGCLRAESDGTSVAPALTCSSSGRGHLLIGDAEGNVRFLSRPLGTTDPLSVALFNSSLSHLVQLKRCGLLVSVGLDEPEGHEYMKVHDFDQPQSDPKLVRLSRVSLQAAPMAKVSCIAVLESGGLLALGFSNGTVLLQRGDITRERAVKNKILMEGDHPVTGMTLKASGKNMYLYVSTECAVICFNVTTKDKETRSDLDEVGCSLGLGIAVEHFADTHFVTGRNNGVYCYTPDGRGQCFAFEGEKICLHSFRNYLVVVSAMAPSDNEEDRRQLLTIFDVENKYIAFTAPVRQVHALLSEWGALYAITSASSGSPPGDYRLLQMTEKDVKSKLEVLFKKNLYDIAVKIAKSQQYDESGLIDIFRQYGDHLYGKGEYAGAMDNYIKTIGHLEPSYIITKFLDAHKINHLTDYLKALHDSGRASEDHTTLLLSCYTKLKDLEQIENFTMRAPREDRNGKQAAFDVDLAIKVCRQAGYNTAAVHLARDHQRHEWYLRLQIEDEHKPKEALDYIETLPFNAAEFNMKKYGPVLMKSDPHKVTEIVKSLCTGYKPSGELLVSEADLHDRDGGEDDLRSSNHSDPENFLNLFSPISEFLVDFLEHVISQRSATPAIYNALLNAYLQRWQQSSEASEEKAILEKKLLVFLKKRADNYDTDHAMAQCVSVGFNPGALFLYEQRGLYGEILRWYMNAEDTPGVLRTCRTFGKQNPNLWIQALRAVASDSGASKAQVTEVLEAIETHRLLSPVQILEMLASSSNATIGILREYLKSVFEREDARVCEDGKVIEGYAKETDLMKAMLAELKARDVVLQISQCSACNHPLEHPSVHFLCQHSYHQTCFQSYSDSDVECPACHIENKKVSEILHSQEKRRGREDEFLHQMETSEDKFKVVAEYMGLGVFRPTEKDVASCEEARPAAVPTLSESVVPRVGPGAEARMRAAQESNVINSTTSEARLRALERQAPKMLVSEERLRASQPSEATRGLPVSVGRMRLSEHNINDNQDLKTKRSSPKPTSGSAPNPSNNPFGEPQEDDLGSNNPFAQEEPKSSTNPFGEPAEDDYDESMNPFAE